MKNKNALIVIGVVIIIVIILFASRSKSNPSNLSGNTIVKTEKKQESGIISSIKDAIAQSLSFKCEYITNNNKTVVYVKGKSVMIEGSWQAKSNTGTIIKDDKLWSWDTVKKEGIIMPLNVNNGQNQGLSSEAITNNLEAQKQFCKVAVVADSIFTPPNDVKFQDLSQFLQKVSGMPQQ